MAVIARDIFSGDADADIDGRTPDGGLDPSTAVGTWDFVGVAGSTCCIEVVPSVGAQRVVGVASSDSHYVVTGTGVGDAYYVRATVDFRGAGFGAFASALGNHSNTALTGYEFYVQRGPLTGNYFYGLLHYSAGSSTTLIDTQSTSGETGVADGPHTIELSRAGAELTCKMDGVVKLFYNLTDPGLTLTGGNPGICMSNGTAVQHDVAVTLWEVETYIGTGPAPDPTGPCTSSVPQAIYSQDCFQGPSPLTGGLETLPPDGCGIECLVQGRWHDVQVDQGTPPQYVYIGHALGDNFTTLVQVNPGATAFWNHETAEDIPNLGNDYSVEVEGFFTAVGGDFGWVSVIGRAQTGDVARGEGFSSNDTWVCPGDVAQVFVECWGGGGSGGAATGNPAAGGGGSGGAYASKMVAVTPGTSYAIVVGADTAGASGAGINGNPTSFGGSLVVAAGGLGGGLASVNSTNGAGGAPNTVGSVGDTIVAGGAGTAGNFTSGAAGGNGGAGANGGGAATGPTANNALGALGLQPGGGGGGGKALTATDRNGGGGAHGRVSLSFTEQSTHGKESCWEFILDTDGNATLYWNEAASYHAVAFNTYPVVAGERFRLKLCCNGSQFCGYINDTLIVTTSDSRYPTGLPGLCILDQSGGSTLTRITKWKVASDEANAPLCGPGDTGGEHGSDGGEEEIPAVFWVRRNNAWREVEVPLDTATSKVHPRAKDVHRPAMIHRVRAMNAWRELVAPTTGGGGGDSDAPGTTDPGDTFFDPGCGVTEETPPLPPVVGPPLPLSDRFFGISNYLPSQGSEIFNGFKTSVGGWTPGDLALLQSRNSVLVGAQGGYGKFLTGGRFEKNHFLSVTLDMLLPIASSLQAYSPNTFFAYSMIDDFDSHTLWPPTGVSDADLVYIMNGIRSAIPGIRVGLRGRPSQFSSNLGFDFYGCQYVSWKHGDPYAFGISEYSRAAGWGSWITMDLNYYSGGNGESGLNWSSRANWYVCSPREVVFYLTEMFEAARSVDNAAHLAGSLGYKWDNRLFSINGMVDALITARNALAALPALP